MSWAEVILFSGLATLLATMDATHYDDIWRGFLNGSRLIARLLTRWTR